MIKRSKAAKTKITWLQVAYRSLESEPVPIMWGGLVDDTKLLDKSRIPVLGLNLSSRPDIREMLRVHSVQQKGDVESRWASWSEESSTILLLLSFLKPSELKVILEFDIAEQGLLVDLILHRRAVGLQPSQPGEVPLAVNQGCLFLEVIATGFESKWDELLRRELKRSYRNEGMRRKLADQRAERTISEWRSLHH